MKANKTKRATQQTATVHTTLFPRPQFRLFSLDASQHILHRYPSSEIDRAVAGRAPGVKNTLECMAGLTLALVCVAAGGHTVTGMSERDQRLTKGLVKSRIRCA